MTYDATASRHQLGQIYKTASSRMTKKALDWDSLKDSFKNLNISDDAKMALLGGLGGAGIGLAAHLITPKDKDEDLRGRMLSQILTGAALGGIAGYGGSRLYKRVAPMVTPEKPGWYQRNAPEVTYSGTATLAGLGAGAYAGVEGANAIRSGIGLNRLRDMSPSAARGINLMKSTLDKDIVSDPKLIAVQDALSKANQAYRESPIKDKLLRMLPGWLPKRLGGDEVRRALSANSKYDEALFDALRAAGKGSGTNPYSARIVKSRLTNPRKVLNSVLKGGKGKKALGAAGLALLLLGGGAALRGVNK